MPHNREELIIMITVMFDIGVFGVPIKRVALSLVEALDLFDSSVTPSSTLKEIHIVDISKDNIQVITRVLQQGLTSLPTHSSDKRQQPKHGTAYAGEQECHLCKRKSRFASLSGCSHMFCKHCLKHNIKFNGQQCPECQNYFSLPEEMSRI